MTAPGNLTTIDDYEKSLAAEGQPKSAETKLEGDGIPDEFKGKSVAELLQHAEGLKKSLLLSEQVRSQMGQAPVAPAPAPVKVEEPKEMTDDELAELHREDPVKAIRVMQDQAVRIAQRNLEARIGPLAAGTNSAVENSARAKYVEEFAALGPEIQQIIDGLPNKSILADPVAWEQVVQYARGQHFDKMMEYKVSKTRNGAAAVAREAEASAAGFSSAPTQSNAASRGPVVMDAYTEEIARNLNMTPEDYIKWSKV